MTTETATRDLLTIEEVADRYATTPVALYSQRHKRHAPGVLAIRVGRRLLWRRSDLDRWDAEKAAEQRELAAS